jgi:hypothetical protein
VTRQPEKLTEKREVIDVLLLAWGKATRLSKNMAVDEFGYVLETSSRMFGFILASRQIFVVRGEACVEKPE